MTAFYTGIGSRSTPPEVMAQIEDLAGWLNLLGYTLRSGAAEGADTAFENGARPDAHIYLPWPGFGSRSNVRLNRPEPAAFSMAATVHPAWSRLSSGPRALHARNCHQVFGDNLFTPSQFVVCWTADGCDSESKRTKATGGTATAIALASRAGIPVFNLRNPGAMAALEELVMRELI